MNGSTHASTSIKQAWKAAGESDDEHEPPRASALQNGAHEVIDVSSDSEECNGLTPVRHRGTAWEGTHHESGSQVPMVYASHSAKTSHNRLLTVMPTVLALRRAKRFAVREL